MEAQTPPAKPATAIVQKQNYAIARFDNIKNDSESQRLMQTADALLPKVEANTQHYKNICDQQEKTAAEVEALKIEIAALKNTNTILAIKFKDVHDLCCALDEEHRQLGLSVTASELLTKLEAHVDRYEYFRTQQESMQKEISSIQNHLGNMILNFDKKQLKLEKSKEQQSDNLRRNSTSKVAQLKEQFSKPPNQNNTILPNRETEEDLKRLKALNVLGEPRSEPQDQKPLDQTVPMPAQSNNQELWNRLANLERIVACLQEQSSGKAHISPNLNPDLSSLVQIGNEKLTELQDKQTKRENNVNQGVSAINEAIQNDLIPFLEKDFNDLTEKSEELIGEIESQIKKNNANHRRFCIKLILGTGIVSFIMAWSLWFYMNKK